MNFSQVVDVIAAAVAIAAFMGAVIFKPGRKFIRRASQFFDDWNGEPARPGISAARLGVLARLTSSEAHDVASDQRQCEMAGQIKAIQDLLSVTHDTVQKELTRNGGGSMKDQLTRADKTLNPGAARDVSDA